LLGIILDLGKTFIGIGLVQKLVQGLGNLEGIGGGTTEGLFEGFLGLFSFWETPGLFGIPL